MKFIPKRLRRPWVTTRTTVHNDNSKTEFISMPSIIPTPYCRWFEHPVWWWKMRHLRADIKFHQDALDGMLSADMQRRLNELEDEAFLNGTGGK